MTWEKKESVALQEEVLRVCLELLVSQVIRALPAMGKMAETASKVPQEWQEFLACLGPQVLQALLVSVSQPLAPFSQVKEHLAKGLTSERLSVLDSLHTRAW